MAYTTPRTWTPGETPTATQLNTHLRDNMSYVYAPDDTWTTLTQTDWSALSTGGGRALAYRLVAGSRVQLRGTIVKGTTPGAGVYTFPSVLPAGYRPAQNRYFAVSTNDTNGVNKAYVSSGGAIVVQFIGATATWVSFEGIEFDINN